MEEWWNEPARKGESCFPPFLDYHSIAITSISSQDTISI